VQGRIDGAGNVGKSLDVSPHALQMRGDRRRLEASWRLLVKVLVMEM
jgi:hypothetical protein